MLVPQAGYLASLPRLVALAVQPLPLRWAPAIFNIAAIAIQVLPAAMLVGRRFMGVNLSGRALLALLYLAIPNAWEVHANLTNAQWHLALLACTVTLAEPSRALGWRVFDGTVLAFTALTGPFGIVLAPIAGVVWWLRRDPQRLIALAILASGAVIQTIVLSPGLGSRTPMPLGASPALLIKILSRHVFLGVIEGVKHPLAQFTDQNLLLSARLSRWVRPC